MPETLYDRVGPAPDFLVTKEHRRFTEFVEACRRERYIGLCHGAPGVGKTISARHYAHWDAISPHLSLTVQVQAAINGQRSDIPEAVQTSRTVVWTPPVAITPRQLSKQIAKLSDAFNILVERAMEPETDVPDLFRPDLWNIELLIVDEADRLKTAALEQLRDFFDRHEMGLVLIGMPGIERKLARYPQLYSRIGFAHRYNTLSPAELRFVLSHHWERLGLTLSAYDFADSEAIAAVAASPAATSDSSTASSPRSNDSSRSTNSRRHQRGRRSSTRDTRHRHQLSPPSITDHRHLANKVTVVRERVHRLRR